MTPTFLLDTNIVSYFLQAGCDKDLAFAAGATPLAIAEKVKEELLANPQRGGKAFERWLAVSHIRVLPILVGSEASTTLQRLTDPENPNPKGVGERASIALAAADPSLVLVTHDQGAIWLATREIWRGGARLMGVAPFLRMLIDEGTLTAQETADEVLARSGKPEQRPTWWQSWRAGRAAPATTPGAS